MKRFTKDEFHRLLKERYPRLSAESAISRMKKDYAVVVVNRKNSSKKAYLVCESFLK